MKRFIVENHNMLAQAHSDILNGNANQATGKKQSNAGKFIVETFLKTERETIIETLPIGFESMIVLDGQDCIGVSIGSQERFNLELFRSEHPELAAKYTQPAKVVNIRANKGFKPKGMTVLSKEVVKQVA